MLVPIGAVAYHDSLRGDQTIGLFYFDKDAFIMIESIFFFSVVGPIC